jgi:hypothetical protein
MIDSTKSLLEFPSAYTIKVLGRDAPGFVELVASIVAGHAPDSGEADCRPSSNGRFVSINITFTAQSLQQLESIHLDLNACDRVTLIL